MRMHDEFLRIARRLFDGGGLAPPSYDETTCFCAKAEGAPDPSFSGKPSSRLSALHCRLLRLEGWRFLSTLHKTTLRVVIGAAIRGVTGIVTGPATKKPLLSESVSSGVSASLF